MKNPILETINASYILQFDELSSKAVIDCLNKLTPELLEHAFKVVDADFKAYIVDHPEKDSIKVACLQYYFAIYLLISSNIIPTGGANKVDLREKIAKHNGLDNLLTDKNLDFLMGACGMDAQNMVIGN